MAKKSGSTPREAARPRNDSGRERRGTVAWYGDLFCGANPAGSGEAWSELQRSAPAATRDFKEIHAHESQPVERTDADDEDHIGYEGFALPSLWQAPYSILKVTFHAYPDAESQKNPKYMYHAGEELLVPCTGDMSYRFFWTSRPGERPDREIIKVDPDVLIRINPQLPHHTYSLTGASAWMVFRHLTETPLSISRAPNQLKRKTESSRGKPSRRIEEEHLRENIARWLLIALGISERLTDRRQRVPLSVAEVAALARVDAPTVYALERASANVTLESLIAVARVLDVNITPQRMWRSAFARLTAGEQIDIDTQPTMGGVHTLHPEYVELAPQGENWKPKAHRDGGHNAEERFSSWIVLSGKAIFTVPLDMPWSPVPAEKQTRDIILEEGSVLHFRYGKEPIEVAADYRVNQSTRLLRIECS